ncbi:hypothetical protein AAFF_G00331870 [Aldrovandia affinis]|uniref:Uncharacterized protein n=1 Tax=Aldrovandia affinis TaxID=143900 RepID=A0AAD7SLU1_9TELE|nr:hypothetical protein AAFF_G00331870 [Aldrovandia affinis]
MAFRAYLDTVQTQRAPPSLLPTESGLGRGQCGCRQHTAAGRYLPRGASGKVVHGRDGETPAAYSADRARRKRQPEQIGFPVV